MEIITERKSKMYKAAVLTISDKGARGERIDTSGPAIRSMLEHAGYDVTYYKIIPDEMEEIKKELIKCSDEQKVQLVLTTGGTGFSPRDITPEATLAVIDREARGIPTAMCVESLKITNRASLSRSVAGIRGNCLIVNLPGSEKAAKENLVAVLDAIAHGLDMIASSGSADCAAASNEKKKAPSMDEWLKEAKKAPEASKIGMYLVHNGVVRETAKAKVREGNEDTKNVTGMFFTYDREKIDCVIEQTKALDGIYYVRVWLNEGELKMGEDIMYVLIGGDIRPHAVEALDFLVGKIKTECVTEREIFRKSTFPELIKYEEKKRGSRDAAEV